MPHDPTCFHVIGIGLNQLYTAIARHSDQEMLVNEKMNQAGTKVMVSSMLISYTLKVALAQWFSTLPVHENYPENFLKNTV
jgi:hypothetical protein